MTFARVRAPLLAPLLFAIFACAPAAPVRSGVSVAGRGLPVAASVTSGPEACGNALDDNGNGLADEGCGTPSGLVAFAAAWEEPTVDVDLRVLDPNGELAEAGRPTGSGLVKERDCPGREGECRGRNLELVYLEQSEVPRGDYRVKLRLVALGQSEPPVEVRFSARLGQRSHGAVVTLERLEEDWEGVLRP